MNEKNIYNKSYWKNTDPNYLNYKKKVLKLLKILGIDTRYISYSPSTIYINDIRFSKFSKKREKTFKKYFPEIAIVRSTIFQKICNRASKILAEKLHPKDNILLLKPQNEIDELLGIVLEPYSRKYGIDIFESNFLSIDEAISGLNNDVSKSRKTNINETILMLNNEKTNIDIITSSLTLNEKVESILSSIFSGNGIINEKKENNEIKIIYPFINVSNEWINLFFDNSLNNDYKEDKSGLINNNIFLNNNYKEDKSELINNNISNNENDPDKIAISFMKFLDDIVPQYKENILKSAIFIKNYNKDIN
jgi:hypothetical protein